jgi:glycosyltransferase involved in cell wall biosynthesis
MMRPSRSDPWVSVVIPAYNAERYLADTIESVLAQTFRSFEIIIVDDGSTDNTKAIAESFRADGVSVVTQANAGTAAARNRALSVARGRFISLLDSDDLWEPDCLQTMVEFLEQHPQVSIAFCDSRYFGETKFAGRTYQELYPPNAPLTFARVAGLVSHVCLDAMLRREVFDDIGGFDDKLRAVEDFDLWVRALHAGYRIEPVPRVLVHYRRHAASVSAGAALMYSSAVQVLEKWRAAACLDREDREAVERGYREMRFQLDVRTATDHIRAGEFALAKAALQRACAYRPKWRYLVARLGLAIAPGMTRLALRRSG